MKRTISAGILSIAALAVAALAGAGLNGAAEAQDKGPFANQIEARHGIMVYRAMNIGALGAMAKGEVAYDAAAAQKAADNLAAAAHLDDSMLWPEGSDNGAHAGTIALPALWADKAGFDAKYADFRAATEAMQGAAGQGLEALQAEMGKLGPTCGACHKAYRAPNN